MSDDSSPQAAPAEGAALPRLREVLTEHALGQYSWGPEDCTYPCEWQGAIDDHPAHQAAMWRETCTIRTVEQLNALPGNAVVRGTDGYIVERQYVRLPAVLLWHPEWEEA
ncbi:hypothetical protein [Mycobacterium sp. NPDC050853]|uniref:hypothetical protein n=1 Tax=Mycobacterium sp. NPDC050853 TaxID=3155160 RepID=UPI0033C4B323